MQAREFSLIVLQEIQERQAYANIALDRNLLKHSLNEADRRLATEIIYGVVKTAPTLTWIAEHFCKRPFQKIDQIAQILILIGLYQIFHLEKIPVSAVCNEAVKLAKKYSHQGIAKFVNAVLRNSLRGKDSISFPDFQQDPVKYISLRFYHPMWLVDQWVSQYGAEFTKQLCQANNQVAPLSLRVNSLKTSREQMLQCLSEKGYQVEPSLLSPVGILCYSHPALIGMKELHQGMVQVQDEASMLIAPVLDPQPGETVLDVCAAPGGKSTHLAEYMQNQGRIIAMDLYAHKLNLIEENANKLGISIIETSLGDAQQAHSRYAQQADRVLVDAPCSGLGVIRRRADLRWRKTPQELQELPKLQTSILNSAAQCLKPGGTLVYSTCTVQREENQAVIEYFLCEQSNFQLESVGDALAPSRPEGMLQLWPSIDGCDGFFIARLRKKLL